jgi:hypothetical protein
MFAWFIVTAYSAFSFIPSGSSAVFLYRPIVHDVTAHDVTAHDVTALVTIHLEDKLAIYA